MTIYIPTPNELINRLDPAQQAETDAITTRLVAETEQQVKIQGNSEAVVTLPSRVSNTVIDALTFAFLERGWNMDATQETDKTTIRVSAVEG